MYWHVWARDTKFWDENINKKNGTSEHKSIDGQFMELVAGCDFKFIQ
jgi:hypothetical protein